ncbi:MAG: hypothetical protein AB7K24_08930 [Gemmataceae bacterium]
MNRRFLSLLILVAGCGGPASYPVKGVVQFKDGTPLPGGSIELQAIAAPGTPIYGDIDEQGRFALSAPATGEFRVIVLPREEGSSGFQPAPEIIDPRFRKYETSGLTLTVKEDGSDISLQVERPGQR